MTTEKPMRMTYDFSEPGRLKSRMEMSSDGAEWKIMFEGSLSKS
jgi:hypothetical protein